MNSNLYSRVSYALLVQILDSELLWQIYEDLQSVKLNIEEIRANQRREEEIRQKHKIEDGIQENFISKHDLDLPFAKKENFDEFNEDLLSNEDFRKEFVSRNHQLCLMYFYHSKRQNF